MQKIYTIVRDFHLLNVRLIKQFCIATKKFSHFHLSLIKLII